MERWLARARRIRQTIGGERLWNRVRPIYWALVGRLTHGRGVEMSLTDGQRYRLDVSLYATQPHHYEPEVVGALFDAVRSDSVVYDIGAHVGMVTLMLARRLEAGRGRVYAFEPSPVNAMLLRQHLLFNGVADRAVVFERLVGERPVDAADFSYFPSGFATMNSLAKAPPGTRRTKVPMVTIDDLIEQGTIPRQPL
jgi:FkbM family methyltransferase